MNTGKILVIDDEPQIRRVMRMTLSAAGYEVTDAKTSVEGLQQLRAELPDLVLLDMNLPDMSGLEACRAIRNGSSIPIVILSVRNGERDKIDALNAGADDYVTKPFSMEELLARIRAVLRRTPNSPEAGPRRVSLDGLEIDFDARRVKAGDKVIHLTPKEFDLLRHLVANAGRPVSHRRLLQAVWGPDYGSQVEYLRVFINQIRKKIEPDAANPKYLVTERWFGYRFVLPDSASALSS